MKLATGAVTVASGAVVALAALTGACRRASPTGGDGPAPTASAAAFKAPVPPVDQLAPGELLEGTDKAFGVILPRGLRIDGAFADVIMVSGPVSVHPLVAYLRGHLQNGDLREGDSSATFDHVTAPGSERPLSVHILKVGEGVHVDIRDMTPAVLPPMPDEAARWQHVGLTPSGRLLDPTHLD